MLFTTPLPSPAPEIVQNTGVGGGADWWITLLAALSGAVVGGVISGIVSWKIHRSDSRAAQKLQQQAARDAKALQKTTEVAKHTDALLHTLHEFRYIDFADFEQNDMFGYLSPDFRRDYNRHVARIVMWSDDKQVVKNVFDELSAELGRAAVNTAQAGEVATLYTAGSRETLDDFVRAIRLTLGALIVGVERVLVALPTGLEQDFIRDMRAVLATFKADVATDEEKSHVTSYLFYRELPH